MFDLWDAEGRSRPIIYLSIDLIHLSSCLSIDRPLLAILGRKGPLSKSARDMLAHFAEVMKPALERYFLGRFRLRRGSVHARECSKLTLAIEPRSKFRVLALKSLDAL